MRPTSLRLIALPGLPLVTTGDDLATLILEGVERSGEELQSGDVLVVAQKIVSKSEGRFVELGAVEPSERAILLAREVDKDPRLVEVILRESSEVVRHRQGVLIVAHWLGLVIANAGVDHSNVLGSAERGRVLLLPEDPDKSAEALRREIARRCSVDVGVIINDSSGRAWRRGTVGIAIGAAGLVALQDLRGREDLFGRVLEVSEEAVADELAAAANLVQGQAAEASPVVLVRGFGDGLRAMGEPQPATVLVRPRAEDLFR